MTTRLLVLMLSALLFMALSAPLEAYPQRDPALIPQPAEALVPFAPVNDVETFYLPGDWKAEQQGESRWTFTASQTACPSPVSAELRTGRDFRTFREFTASLQPGSEQCRIVGPIGFPDKFDDTRERWFFHFIRDGRIYTAFYGSVVDVRRETQTALELVFATGDFDYFDSLSYAIICNVSAPGRTDIRDIQCYQKCPVIYECTALMVPLLRATAEETVSSYYACLITNRWEKARAFLSRTVDIWPPCYDIAYKERAWWALKWFRLIFTRHYEDRMECAILKGVHQFSEEQDGVDYAVVKKQEKGWAIVSFP